MAEIEVQNEMVKKGYWDWGNVGFPVPSFENSRYYPGYSQQDIEHTC